MGSYEKLSSETVAGKKVEVWKDEGGGVRKQSDYQVRIPVALGMKEKYWIEADNKEEVMDTLRNGGTLEDEYGSVFNVENPVEEATFNVEFAR